MTTTLTAATTDLATYREEFPGEPVDVAWFSAAFEMTDGIDWEDYWDEVKSLADAPMTAKQLAEWVRADPEEYGRASLRDLMGFIYSDWEYLDGDSLYADEQLTAAGLLRPQTERTHHCDSWRTQLGRDVASVLDFHA